ncbi:MAG: hypothetical protein U0230_14260 [Polyangiales bacterium]
MRDFLRRTTGLGGVLVAVLLCVFCASESARADGSLGPEGTPITTSDYSVDFTRGPVLSSSRATGLSGAFSSIAEGAEGGLTNPAAVANRYNASADSWDYWLALGFTYPIENGDFFNSGNYLDKTASLPASSFFFLNPGAYLQLKQLGFGLDLDITQATIRGTPAGSTQEQFVKLSFITNHVQVGYLFWDGQLSIGGGLQVVREFITGGVTGQPGDQLYNTSGFGGEVGVLLRPNDRQWRLGAGYYSGVRTRARGDASSTGDIMAGNLYLPASSLKPMQGSLSFAYQFGSRPLNPRWTYVDEHAHEALAAIDRREELARRSHDERMAEIRATDGTDFLTRLSEEEHDFEEQTRLFEVERAAVRKQAWRDLRAQVRTGWPRRYLLLVSELTFTGRVPDGVGVESFLLQTVQRSGERVTFTPRIAVESEVWPQHMKLRTGFYLEPTRFAESNPRLHWTFGFDVKLFRWDVFRVWPEDYLWQLIAALDVTTGYSAFSLGIGGWY